MAKRGEVFTPREVELGRVVKAAYVFHFRLHEERRTGVPSRWGLRPVPQWDGGRDRSGREMMPVWPKVARALMARRVDAAEFVAAQFFGQVDPPRPNQLLSEAAFARYEARTGDATLRAAAELRAEEQRFANAAARRAMLWGCGASEAARAVLRDPTSGLSPMYRYCVASRTHEDMIAGEWKERAVAQYMSGGSGYRLGWAAILPPALEEEAEELMSRLAGRDGSDV